MTIWDDRILEVIREDPDNVSKVSNLVENDYIRISQSQVSRRCKKLAEHGLLRPLGDGVYMLTEHGEDYLDGEIDTSEDASNEVDSPDTDGGKDLEESGSLS